MQSCGKDWSGMLQNSAPRRLRGYFMKPFLHMRASGRAGRRCDAEPSRSNRRPWADERSAMLSKSPANYFRFDRCASYTFSTLPDFSVCSATSSLFACSPLRPSSCFTRGRTTGWKIWLSTSSHCSTCALSVGVTPYKLGVPWFEYLSQMYRMIVLDSATISTYVVMSDRTC